MGVLIGVETRIDGEVTFFAGSGSRPSAEE
jgi:hypothetical protein